MSDLIYLSNVRLSFPHIAKPRPIQADKPDSPLRYDADLIMAPDHASWLQFMKRVNELAVEEWKEHAGPVLQLIQTDRKLRCYGNGAEKVHKETFKPLEGYEGNVFISANKYADKGQPQIIRADGTAIDANNTMEIQTACVKLYGGCRVNAAVRPWAQNNKHGRGIRCDLIAIQFFADDKPFGEGVQDATPLFGAVAGAAPAPAPAPFGLPAFMTGQ